MWAKTAAMAAPFDNLKDHRKVVVRDNHIFKTPHLVLPCGQ